MTVASSETDSSASASGDEGDREFTSTLAAGMALLSAFREGDGALANRDFVARTGLAKANVSRLAFTLVALGFLRRDAVNGRYRLGSSVLSMGYPLLAGMQIRQIARPYMREMADELEGTVSMGVRDRSQIIYVETSRSDRAEAGFADIGTALPLLHSAMGVAWLTAVSLYERERAVNHALVSSGRQGDSKTRLATLAAVKQAASAGYVCVVGRDAGTLTIATPLRSPVNGEVIVLDCVILSPNKASAKLVRTGQRMILTARSIESAMSMR